MKEFHELIARVGARHWILLSQNSESGTWTFRIWGTSAKGEDFGLISESEAKVLAWAAFLDYVRRHGLKNELSDASELSWRVAVTFIPA